MRCLCQAEQLEKEQKRKEKEEAHLFTYMKVRPLSRPLFFQFRKYFYPKGNDG